MCNSRYAAAFLSSLPLSFTRSKSMPTFFSASGKRMPSLSLRPRASFMSRLPEQADEPNKTFAEPRAFFIRPIHETNGHRRLAVVLRVDAPQNFDAGEDVEATIEPAAIRHGIHVAADEQRLFGFAAQCEPEISGRIVVNFDRQRLQVFCAAMSRALSHVGVNATRCAPFSSPVSARSSLSSATVRFGSEHTLPWQPR